MKKLLLIIGVALIIAGCGNNNDKATNEDPSKVQPVSEAIPGSLKLVNDSAIVPDKNADSSGPGTVNDSTSKRP